MAAVQQLPPLDLLVVGSGVAGLSAAVRAAEVHGLSVGVLTKGELHQATTRWAQGGVAAVLDEDPDSTDLHLADTLAAGAGLCDAEAVRVLVDEGPARVHELIALGAIFDRDAHGRLEKAREGGHTLARVVHAGGAATGAEVERALVAAVHRTATVVLEGWFAADLFVEGGRCAGVTAVAPDGGQQRVRATHVLLATGGAGQLFAVTTNPVEATGDGVAMALRAGVAVADVEFVQFHPTALHATEMPRPLLTEALRGHGAVIRDRDGQRFIDELQPRDVVSRAMCARMLHSSADNLWLDATGLDQFAARFPTIASALARLGLDPAHDWLPIAPAAHYLCGGVVSDLDGATTLRGLWVAGETSCTGVHGANRLASNSLLEGMVFGPRVVEAIAAGVDGPHATGAMGPLLGGSAPSAADGVEVRWLGDDPVAATAEPAARLAGTTTVGERRAALQREMTLHAGVLRSADSLAAAAAHVASERAWLRASAGAGAAFDEGGRRELANLLEVAAALIASATLRAESRGAHTRSDHPETRDELRVRLLRGTPAGR